MLPPPTHHHMVFLRSRLRIGLCSGDGCVPEIAGEVGESGGWSRYGNEPVLDAGDVGESDSRWGCGRSSSLRTETGELLRTETGELLRTMAGMLEDANPAHLPSGCTAAARCNSDRLSGTCQRGVRLIDMRRTLQT